MCGLPFHLLDCIPVLDVAFTMRHALRSLPIVALLGLSCTPFPATQKPDVALVHAVVSGVHDVVSTAHQVWSMQLNARIDLCRKQLPPESSSKEQFVACLAPYDKNDVVLAHLTKLVEVQQELRDGALQVADVQARAKDAIAVARSLLGMLKAADHSYAQVKNLEALLGK